MYSTVSAPTMHQTLLLATSSAHEWMRAPFDFGSALSSPTLPPKLLQEAVRPAPPPDPAASVSSAIDWTAEAPLSDSHSTDCSHLRAREA